MSSEQIPLERLGAALESLLIVTDEPVSTEQLARLTGHPDAIVEKALLALQREYAGASVTDAPAPGSDPANAAIKDVYTYNEMSDFTGSGGMGPDGVREDAQLSEGQPEQDGRLAGKPGAVRGFQLRRVEEGWRFYSSPEFSALVSRYVRDGQSVRLTQAALETLAVIAYRQPVSRSHIAAIRGVNVDGVVRTLVQRGLVRPAEPAESGSATLYRTTDLLLEKLGIESLEELPQLSPLLPGVADLEGLELDQP